jgi:hypothetical protein
VAEFRHMSSPAHAVHLGAREEDHPEFQPLLESDQVLRSDHVGLPEVLVVVLSVPPAVFRGKVVDIIEFLFVEDPFELPEVPDVSPDVVIPLGIIEIAGRDFVSSLIQFVDEVCPDKPRTACDKNP